jgi:formylmethanofuran dehydrogenase subunit C
MSLTLKLHTAPEVPLEAALLSPQQLAGMNGGAVAKVQVHHGNRAACVGDFFKVEGKPDDVIHMEGDLANIKHLGSGMSSGHLHIHGNAGAHLGAGMSGGEILVDGNATDWVGPEMSGGRIIIKGDAGHMVGSAYRGSTAGMQGGEIIVHGSVRNEAGHAMRNGLIMVGGACGDFSGVNLLAGTIIVCGEPGIRSGAGMKRGTIIHLHKTEILPTFTYSCMYEPIFIRMLLRHARDQGLPVTDKHLAGRYHRWCGDSVEQSRGEILVYNG